jgi:hypothetical protein
VERHFIPFDEPLSQWSPVPSPPPSDTQRSVLLVALLACSVVAGPAVAGHVGSPTAETAETTATNAGGPGEYTEHRGDVASPTLSVGNATDATVALTAADGGYEANLSVTDRDGDGEVTLHWNTYLAGHGGAFAATGEDAVAVRDETDIDARVPAGRYDVAVTADGESVDAAAVELVSPAAPAVRSMIPIPGRDADLSTVEQLRASEANGSLRPADRFGLSDRFVLALTVPGIEGALAAQPGSNVSERLASLADSDGFALSVRENASTVTVEASPIRLGFVGDGVDVLAAPTRDTYYLVYSADETPRRVDRGYYFELEEGDWLDVNVTVGPASGLVAERQSGTLYNLEANRWHVPAVESIVTYVRPAANQTITAPTTLPAGSQVTVVVEGPDGFSATRSGRVVPHGDRSQVRATVDLSSVPAGAELAVRVLLDGEPLRTHRWRDHFEMGVGVADADYGVSIRDVNRTGDPAAPLAVRVDATLPDRSFVVLHADSADGPVLGGTGRHVAGTYESLEVTATGPLGDPDRVVAVVHSDVDGDREFEGDPPVLLNGTPIAGSKPFPPAGSATATQTPSPTTGQTVTTSPTSTAVAGGSATPTPTPIGTTSPGLGVLAALFAAGIVLLSVRRR